MWKITMAPFWENDAALYIITCIQVKHIQDVLDSKCTIGISTYYMVMNNCFAI